jgi:cytochrome b
MRTVSIWDLPLRLFHWLLVASMIGAYVTAKLGGALMDWHGRLGFFILGLLIFRLVWGFIGSPHARFSSFFPTFSRVAAYLRGRWQGVGHNPLGGLFILAVLAALALQVGTGLFANDDIAFEGPLVGYVDKALSDRLTGWHSLLFNLLLGLVLLHLAAIIYYRWAKKNNLVLPMLTGKKRVPAAVADKVGLSQPIRFGALRFILSVSISGILVWGITGGIAQLYPYETGQPPATQAYAGF